jgi:KUP system potassium uptake protein
MLLTTVLLYNVMRKCWQWPFSVTLPLCGIFLLVDFAFFAANLSKIAQGGWIPLTFGAIIFLLMTTWRTGIEAVRGKLGAITESASHFFKRLADDKIPRGCRNRRVSNPHG